MSHTNSTTNYALPQFLTTDKPAWLTDINNAFLAIDNGMDAAKDAADNAQGDATQALTDAGNAATAAATADAKGAGAIASIEAPFDSTTVYDVGALVMYNNLLYRCTVAVVTPGPWTGVANWERVTVDTLIAEFKAAVNTETDFLDRRVVQSSFVEVSYACSYEISSTIGYRGTGPNITTASGYPTGKRILGFSIEKSYINENIYPAITQLNNNVLYTMSKVSGTAYVGVRVFWSEP